MREIVCIHAGQAGVQLSSAVWELFSVEHELSPSGKCYSEDNIYGSSSVDTFFQQVPSGHFIPRAISVDLEPSVLDEIRTGPYRRLYHPDQLISGFEDAANNFARGHYTLGKDYIDLLMNKLRKTVEMCGCLQGFFILSSHGGGTGSGFSTLVLDQMNVEFPKNILFQTSILPSDKMSMATVEPYNTLLCSTFAIDRVSLCNFFDNESTYNLCSKNLDMPRPTYNNLNMIISQIVSSMTAAIRFQGYLNADLDQVVTNLVPFPRIHFPILSHSPISLQQRVLHQTMNVSELTEDVFNPSNQLVNVDMADAKYMCCCLQYRGKVSSLSVNTAIFNIKRRTDIKFMDWCPTGFKVGINSQPSAYIPKSAMAQSNCSVTLLSNSSAISQTFLMLMEKFDHLFRKRSFVHWYVGEGMEELEFLGAREEMSLISADYFELCSGEEDRPNTQQITKNKEEKENVTDDTKNISSHSMNSD